MLEERRLAVLRAIVEDYVSTHEPVGSKALVERHSLGVSPATIRNDMAALEDEGYIAQPHTSAGRVPTDLGYRLFVDRLSGVKPLSPPERRAIHQFLDDAVDLDDVMIRTVRLLAQITRQVALVQYPSLTRANVRHVEVVSLSSTRLIVVVIADTGRVEQRIIDTAAPVSEAVIGDLRARLIGTLCGQGLLVGARRASRTSTRPSPRTTVRWSGPWSRRCSRRRPSAPTSGSSSVGRPIWRATASPSRSRSSPCSRHSRSRSCSCACSASRRRMQGVTVRIGHENPVEGLEATSVITARYARGDQPVASLGVVGPTHMDYPGTISAVHAVARYVSRILDEQ